MSPLLEAGTIFEERQIAKYVRVGDNIYFSDAEDAIGVAMEKHSTLAKHLGVKIGPNGKTPVDDAGTIGFYNGKFRFSGDSSTCSPIGGRFDKEKTHTIAGQIVGNNKVN